MKKNLPLTVIATVCLLIAGTFITGFIVPGKKSTHEKRHAPPNPVQDPCDWTVYGHYFISGGSDDPNLSHPWDACSNSYTIHGLDPRTINLYPTFGGGGPYTITKLASYPSSLTLGKTTNNCWVTFSTWGQTMTVQITKGAQSQVINFAFAP